MRLYVLKVDRNKLKIRWLIGKLTFLYGHIHVLETHMLDTSSQLHCRVEPVSTLLLVLYLHRLRIPTKSVIIKQQFNFKNKIMEEAITLIHIMPRVMHSLFR